MNISTTAIMNLFAQVDPTEAGVLDNYRGGLASFRTTFPDQANGGPDVAFVERVTVPKGGGTVTYEFPGFNLPAQPAKKDFDCVDVNLFEIYGFAIAIVDNEFNDNTLATQCEFDLTNLISRPAGGSGPSSGAQVSGLLENHGSANYFAWPGGVEVQATSELVLTQVPTNADVIADVVVIGKNI